MKKELKRLWCKFNSHENSKTYFSLKTETVDIKRYVFEKPVKGYRVWVEERCGTCCEVIALVTIVTLNEKQYEQFIKTNSFQKFEQNKNLNYIEDWEHYHE